LAVALFAWRYRRLIILIKSLDKAHHEIDRASRPPSAKLGAERVRTANDDKLEPLC
jgi:hypothetical protein